MKKLIHIYLFLITSHAVFAQENQPASTPFPSQSNQPIHKDFNSFKERLFFGGNVGAWFGSTTYVNISPLVGCKITKQFSLGAGVT